MDDLSLFLKMVTDYKSATTVRTSVVTAVPTNAQDAVITWGDNTNKT
jgi:hypothetical protein